MLSTVKREVNLVVFTTALVSLGYFGKDILPYVFAGDWEAIVGGIENSILGLGISFFVLLLFGWLLIRDAKKEKEQTKRDKEEMIKAIKESVKEGIKEAITEIKTIAKVGNDGEQQSE